MHACLIVRALLVFLAAGALVGSAVDQTKKPVRIEEFEADRTAPPASLDAMWLQAKAVVVVKVLTTTSLAPDVGPRGPGTTYEVEVVDVLKSDPHLTGVGGIVSVFRLGSETDMGEYILKRIESNFPAFVVGHQYLLFLNWNRSERFFVVPYGPDASYEIENGLIRTSGPEATARSLNGKPANELLSKLEAIKKKYAR
jgi:hypothetical protein